MEGEYGSNHGAVGLVGLYGDGNDGVNGLYGDDGVGLFHEGVGLLQDGVGLLHEGLLQDGLLPEDDDEGLLQVIQVISKVSQNARQHHEKAESKTGRNLPLSTRSTSSGA